MIRKNLLYSMGCGILAAAALAPLYVWLGALLGYGLWLRLLYNTPRPQHALLTWAFFSGYFIASLHWLAYPMLVQPEQFALFIPLAVLGLPMALALLHGASMWLWQKIARNILLCAVATITSAEWLRGYIFTGFPWNSPSQILPAYDWALPMLRVLNAEWIIPPLILWLLYPAWCWQWRRFAGLLIWALTPAAVYAYGVTQWQQPLQNAQTLRVQIVQPALSQAQRMHHDGVINTWRTMLQHTAIDPSITHIIWPEAVIPPTDNPLVWLQRVPLSAGQNLIAGAVLFANTNDTMPTNSMLLYSPQQPLQRYDKAHLVPFGEYLPFNTVLTRLGLRVLIDLPQGFKAGTAPSSTLANTTTPPFLPLICYEGIFQHSNPSPAQWNVLITNDAWFGTWAGPAQHLAQAQMRAAETGRPLVRAATTGISAVIDAHGRVQQQLRVGYAGNVVANVPIGTLNPAKKLAFWAICLTFALLLYFIQLSEKNLQKGAK